MNKKIFLIFLITTLFFTSPFIHSSLPIFSFSSVSDTSPSFSIMPPEKKSASPISTPQIQPAKKQSVPVFEVMPPELQEILEESFCSGYVCLPPGESPSSLNLNRLSNKTNRTLEETTLDNKWGTAPTTGTYNIPVLLINFPDLQAPAEYTQALYNDVFNSTNYLSGNGISVKQYFKKNSYDQLNITFDVYNWRTAPNNYSHYYTNNNAHQLVVDTINVFGTGSNAIDFTQYDSDNDGRIDGFIIVHAGLPGQEQNSNVLDQARLYYASNNYTIQGKLYGNAAILGSRHRYVGVCQGWINTFNYPDDCRLSIGSSVHEFAHVLGLPDLYELSYDNIKLSEGLGGHTLMVMNTDTVQDVKKPINFDSWSKFFLGWLSPTVINSASQADIYNITSYDTTNSSFILHNPDTMGEREFFLVTNRYISSTSLDRYSHR